MRRVLTEQAVFSTLTVYRRLKKSYIEQVFLGGSWITYWSCTRKMQVLVMYKI